MKAKPPARKAGFTAGFAFFTMRALFSQAEYFMRAPVSPKPPARAWQRMLSGRRLDLLDPSPLDVEIEDIALGLSRVARWNGQTIGAHGFSVAQHALLVVDLLVAREKAASPRLRLAALLHDASEYVTSDLITPFKAAVGGEYKAVERRLQRAVHLRFGLPGDLPPLWKTAVKQADQTAAYLEAVQLAGFSATEAKRILAYNGPIPTHKLEAWPAETARKRFLAAFQKLSVD